jgi:hypothetical protein
MSESRRLPYRHSRNGRIAGFRPRPRRPRRRQQIAAVAHLGPAAEAEGDQAAHRCRRWIHRRWRRASAPAAPSSWSERDEDLPARLTPSADLRYLLHSPRSTRRSIPRRLSPRKLCCSWYPTSPHRSPRAELLESPIPRSRSTEPESAKCRRNYCRLDTPDDDLRLASMGAHDPLVSRHLRSAKRKSRTYSNQRFRGIA